MSVTEKFMDDSARACIRALRELERTAIMLETYAPEIFPEVNAEGQIHFGRAMMESAAEAIREAFAKAIKSAENSDRLRTMIGEYSPIDTAPQDESILIACRPDWVGEARLDLEGEEWVWKWANGNRIHENFLPPIGWKHLPMHPSAERGDGERTC